MKSMQLTVAVFVILILCLASALLGSDKKLQNANPNSAVVPQASNDTWWIQRHQQILKQIKISKPDIIFIGDSITHGFEGPGQDVWQKYYAPQNAMNMGFAGDRTQHVLWRLEHGEIDGISPKLAIVLIGTNNSNDNDNTAQEISQGIIAVCRQLTHKLPNTKILMIAIFPRGQKPSAQRQKNFEASKLASAIADDKWIYYCDINKHFLSPDGTLSSDLMPDYLHPSAEGYKVWADAIQPILNKLLQD